MASPSFTSPSFTSSSLTAAALRDRLGAWEAGASGDLPRYARLAGAVERLLRDGDLAAGTRLPAERPLADALGASRGTVALAYDRLRETGLVRTRRGSGTVVTGAGSPLSGAREAHIARSFGPGSVYDGVLALDGDAIDLRAAHWEGTEHLPADAFALPDEVLGPLRAGHGYHPLGLPALRAAVAAHLSTGGLTTRPGQVLVTSGAQQALALCAQLLVGPGDAAVVEALTYPGAADVVRAQQGILATAPLGVGGADPEGLRRVVDAVRPRAVVLVGGVHNPTGLVASTASRERIAADLRGWRAVVVEDRTLADVVVEGSSRAPIAAFLEERRDPAAERVLTVGSLSKLAWGGLRVGWVRGAEPVLARLARLKAVNDLGTPVYSQAVAARLLDGVEGWRETRRAALRDRRDVLLRLLGDRLPGWSWTTPQGGLAVWVDTGADTVPLAAAAARHGVGIAPGDIAAPDGGAARHVRLPFGRPEAVLAEGVDRLARAWAEVHGGATRPDDVGIVV